jgi:hypothetical protein
MRKMSDLSREPGEVEGAIRTRFGQSCLLARRLVEARVPFVQVNWSDHVEAEEDSGDGGWDHHYRNFQIMQDRHGALARSALPALLTDLRDRGLLDRTLVVAVGEFGRSPKINVMAGRDHWEHCFQPLVAGRVRGGRVIGESDARGERPHDRPAHSGHLAATVHHAVGITSEQAQMPFGVAVNANRSRSCSEIREGLLMHVVDRRDRFNRLLLPQRSHRRGCSRPGQTAEGAHGHSPGGMEAAEECTPRAT